MLNRFISIALLIFLKGILIAFLFDGYVVAQDKDLGADSIIPIASGITEFPTTIKLKENDREVRVVIPYASQGNTVFLLPVWSVRSVCRISDGSPKIDLKPSDLVFDPKLETAQRLEIIVNDLLAEEVYGKAIREKIRTKLAEDSGKTTGTTNYAFQSPQIKSQSFRFSLIGPGRGDEVLPAEVVISKEVQRLPSGAIRFTVDQSGLKAVEKENGAPLKLAQANIRCTGLMRVKFEQIQVEAQVDFVKGAFNELRKAVSSIKDSKGETPEVFVDSYGGEAKSDSQIRQLAEQSLNVTISARAGAETTPILSLVKEQLSSLLEQQKIKLDQENKQIAFLLENQVCITSTIAEIKRLSKMDEQQRDQYFKNSIDDFESARKGEKSVNSGEMKFGYTAPFNAFKVDGTVGGNSSSDSSQESAKKTKAEQESLKKGYEKILKDFEGKIPAVTGISFNDSTVRESFDRAAKTFKESKITTADSLHRWPLIGLAGIGDAKISMEDLGREYAILKTDYEQLRALVGSAETLREAKENLSQLKNVKKESIDKMAMIEADREKFKKEQARFLSDFKEESKALINKLSNEDVAGLKIALSKLSELKKDMEELKKMAWLQSEEKWPKKISNSFGMKFILVEKGRFTLGSKDGEEGRFPDEFERQVDTLKPYYLGALEVSWKDFKSIIQKSDAEGAVKFAWPNDLEMPVSGLSPQQIINFCELLSNIPEEKSQGRIYRLPTEEEWEYACRAGTQTRFSFGDSLEGLANYGSLVLKQVGSYPPNNWGFYDMHGNALELTSSWYSKELRSYVGKGGNWKRSERYCRSAYRLDIGEKEVNETLGFRLVVEIK